MICEVTSQASSKLSRSSRSHPLSRRRAVSLAVHASMTGRYRSFNALEVKNRAIWPRRCLWGSPSRNETGVFRDRRSIWQSGPLRDWPGRPSRCAKCRFPGKTPALSDSRIVGACASASEAVLLAIRQSAIEPMGVAQCTAICSRHHEAPPSAAIQNVLTDRCRSIVRNDGVQFNKGRSLSRTPSDTGDRLAFRTRQHERAPFRAPLEPAALSKDWVAGGSRGGKRLLA